MIREMGILTARRNSFDSYGNSVVKDIAILSGFDTAGSNQVTPGYIYYKGDIYGFRSDSNLTLGGYLIATKTNTTLRTTAEGTDFYAYTSCELSVSAGAGAADITVGAFTATNIAIWKASSPASLGLTIPNGFITAEMLGNKVVNGINIADGAVQLVNMAASSVGTSQIASSAVTSAKIGSAAVTTAKLGTDVKNLIAEQAPTFIKSSFLSGKLTVFRELHGNLWHINFKDTAAQIPTGESTGTTPFGTIGNEPGATEFMTMIRSSFPNNYRSPVFDMGQGKALTLQISPNGLVAMTYSGKGNGTQTGFSMHDTIVVE